MNRRDFHRLALAAGSLAAVPAFAQAWPAKPIRMIIPSTPGGGTDFTGRQLSTKLAEMNGWSVVPDNRPGAGTALGLAEAARGKPDGYELVIAQSDNVSLMNFRLDKGFTFAGHYKLTGIFDLYNVTNANPVTNFSLKNGNFGRIIAVLDPRVAQVAVRFEF